MGLLEDSGVIIKQDEKIIKRVPTNGKIPRGSWTGAVEDYHRLYKKNVREQMKHGIFNNGELVLTNNRLIAVGKLGLIKKNTIPFMDLELQKIQAVNTEKPFIGKEALVISLNTEPPGKAYFEVENPAEWVKTIKEQLSQSN